MIQKRFFTVLLMILVLIPLKGFAETGEARITPWSGYWWPMRSGGLSTGFDYYGNPAPIEKYNLLTLGVTSGPVKTWYEERFYDPDAPDWYGMCYNWAMASCYEHIDFYPSSENNIVFRVGDKKGLLTLAHTDSLRETGDGTDPVVFHFWLLDYLKDRRKAFFADLDPGEEVWSYPIYSYDMENQVSGTTESVSVRIYYADDHVHPDFVGTQKRFTEFTYDLLLDGSGNIIDGKWTGNSVANHPETLTFPLDARPGTPDLDYAEVLRLAQNKDDFLENGIDDVRIVPGTYNLVLMDPDSYSIQADPGDTVYVSIEKWIGSFETIHVTLLDKDNSLVKSLDVSDPKSPEIFLFQSENPPYTLKLSQSDYDSPNIYSLVLDMVTTYAYHVPYIPMNGMVSQFSVLNPTQTQVDDIMLTAYDENGIPIQTLIGPFSLSAMEKNLFLFDNLPWRKHERIGISSVTLLSRENLSFLNIFGYPDRMLGCFPASGGSDNRLIIPDTMPQMVPGKTLFGSIRNESFSDVSINFRVYTPEGSLAREGSDAIPARGNLTVASGASPFFNMPDSGWIEIDAAGDAMLSGYRYLKINDDMETLFALRVNDTKKYIPHVPPPGDWTTTVTMINPNEAQNNVIIHPVKAGSDTTQDTYIAFAPNEKRVIDVSRVYGKSEGDPLYHSILEIVGDHPITGYFSYSMVGKDRADLPLLENLHFGKEIVLQNYANDTDQWWTGIGIMNPDASQPVRVRVIPYDETGNPIQGDIEFIDLEPGSYQVMLIQEIAGANTASVSFVKFIAESGDPAAVISGFFLQGDPGIMDQRTKLTGSFMP